MNAADIDFSRAKSSYSGAADKCCCGCSGNHSESPVAIKRQISRIRKLAAEGVELDINECLSRATLIPPQTV